MVDSTRERRRGLDSCDECYDRRVSSGDSGDANYRRSRAICWRVFSRDRLSDVPLTNRNHWTDSDKLDHIHCFGGCRGIWLASSRRAICANGGSRFHDRLAGFVLIERGALLEEFPWLQQAVPRYRRTSAAKGNKCKDD